MYNRFLLSLALLSAWTKLYIFTGLDVLQETRNAGMADLIMSDLLVISFFVSNIHCKFIVKTLHHCISIIRDQKRASNIDWSQACVQLSPPLRKNLERSICDLPLIIYIVFKDLLTFSGICLTKQLTFHHATVGFPVK